MKTLNKIEKYLNETKMINEASMINEIKPFWVVTDILSEYSEIEDILFESDIWRMHLQFLGGLKPEQIKGIFKTKPKAKKLALKILKDKN